LVTKSDLNASREVVKNTLEAFFLLAENINQTPNAP
jgi:hypothetical protein